MQNSFSFSIKVNITNAVSICQEKLFFDQDKIRFVIRQLQNDFVHGLKIIFAFWKLVSSHGQNFCSVQKIFWTNLTLSWTNLILSLTKNILSGQLDGKYDKNTLKF